MELPNLSSNYLPCGCHAHSSRAPSTYFNIHLHELLSQANNTQIFELFNTFQSDIYRILLSQFIDRVTLQQTLSFDQQHFYYNKFNQILHSDNIHRQKHQQPSQHVHTDEDSLEIPLAQSSLDETSDDGLDNVEELIEEFEKLEQTHCESQTFALADDVWSRIFQFVDEKTRLLSLPLCSRYLHDIATSPSSWTSLQIAVSPIYFDFKKSYLFSHFLIKSGRCLTSLVLRDIASMNEQHWRQFIDFFTYYCPKIVNVRIRSTITQSAMRKSQRERSTTRDETDSLFHQLIGSNLHLHEYHHYFHNKQIENALRYSNAVKSNMFNTLKVFTKHYKKYGGLLIPQNTPHLNNINHANHLSNHRIAANSNSASMHMDDSNLVNIYSMFNLLQTSNNHTHRIVHHNNQPHSNNEQKAEHERNNDSHHSDDLEHDSDDEDEQKYQSNASSYANLIQSIFENQSGDDENADPPERSFRNSQHDNSNIQVQTYGLNPFFHVKPGKHDLLSFFIFANIITKYHRNELQSDLTNTLNGGNNHGANANNNNGNNSNHNTNINILESFCKLSLHQLKTNCVIRPRHLCAFLQQQPHLIVLKASVRFRRDWSESENEWFWKIPSCLPSNLEIFFLPGHHALPELWVENCLSNLHNLKYFDFFIVNNKYIPSVSINIIYVLAKHCHEIQFVHLHINLEQYIQKCQQEMSQQNDANRKGHRRYHSMQSSLYYESDPYILFTKELGNALQLLFANCLKLQRVYCYLPMKFDPSLLLQQIVFVQLPPKRKCKLRIDEYKIGGARCRRFVFKLMDDVNSIKSNIQ